MTRTRITHLGDLFRSRREPGRPGLPVTSVTMNDGLVRRETLDRKSNGNLPPEQHLLIRKGDIAYNMMRMWQGASGLATQDGIVSPAYVVLAPKDGIDSLFASYWFKSARMIYLFWAYSYGLTNDRLRLYYKDFARIPVAIPRKPEQERIGRLLAAMDRKIERTGKLVANKGELKKGLARHLLTGQRRLAGFGVPAGDHQLPNGWVSQRLEQLATFRSGGTPSKNRPEYWGGSIPWATAQDLKSSVLFDTQEHLSQKGLSAAAAVVPAGTIFLLVRGMALMNEVPITRAGVPMSFNQDIRAIVPAEGINGDYLAGFLTFAAPQLRRFVTMAGHGTGRLEMDAVRALRVAIPPEREQERITAVLGAADQEIALLDKDLIVLRALKRGLMQRLLPGNILGQSLAKNPGPERSPADELATGRDRR